MDSFHERIKNEVLWEAQLGIFFFSSGDRRMLNGRSDGWWGSEDWTLLGNGGGGEGLSSVRGRGLRRHRASLGACNQAEHTCSKRRCT